MLSLKEMKRSAPLCNHHENISIAAQEWVLNNTGFPGPILDELLECSVTREHLEVVHHLVPKGTFIRIPTWFFELARDHNEKLSPSEFDTEVRRRSQESPKRLIVERRSFIYVFSDWELEFYNDQPGFFFGSWKIQGTPTNVSVEFSMYKSEDDLRAYIEIWDVKNDFLRCKKHVDLIVTDRTYDQLLRDLEAAIASPL
jgi:hypothetical protein